MSTASGAGRSAVCPSEALPTPQNWPMDLPAMPSMPEMPPFGSAYIGNRESMAFPDATQEARPISSRSFGLPSGMCMHQRLTPHCEGVNCWKDARLLLCRHPLQHSDSWGERCAMVRVGLG